LFKEKVPQMSDAAEVVKLQSAAMAVLKDHGFDEAEPAASWHGQKDFSLPDRRVQLLIRDAILRQRPSIAIPPAPSDRSIEQPEFFADVREHQSLKESCINDSSCF
jgi:hypothetical protein